jgi:GNAT superfamily N-acetyltransferase
MDACFWLLEEGERVGTLALSRGAVGNSLLLRLSSLYVLPTHRGRGVATRALERMRSVLGSWRYAVRLETCLDLAGAEALDAPDRGLGGLGPEAGLPRGDAEDPRARVPELGGAHETLVGGPWRTVTTAI